MNYAGTATVRPQIRNRFLLRDRFEELALARKNDEVTEQGSGTAHSREIYHAIVSEAETFVGASQLFEIRIARPDIAAGRTVSAEVFENAATASADDLATEAQSRALARTLDSLLDTARDERFEDGMDSNLSVGLRVLLRDYGETFTMVLGRRLQEGISQRVVVEILYTLGAINDEVTKAWRFATLIEFLKSPLPKVRDAAATGIAYLDDKAAAPYLQEAIDREKSEGFKEDLRAVLEQICA